ncbi:hypothetical protein OCGS_1814 [Oceaniovalibus guishaninsula JLT2003]|uniref:Uncharacterized protein n=1 Tax=Oceaniovalibus guishaninsula JLT2003 TaxID=1231392 RepID=K2H9S3_9RHOB|nr:hypothetical protein [Oceaniovalibus guishaninsula]EKE44298.1 hypothetical protein OCGS_1814 [Oceaniovalibus guishaninsula JLT2003]
MDYKKSGAAKGGRNAPRHHERNAKGGQDNPFGPKRKGPRPETPEGTLDKPSTGQDDFAIDERGGKNIRGPEGHAKERHDYDE